MGWSVVYIARAGLSSAVRSTALTQRVAEHIQYSTILSQHEDFGKDCLHLEMLSLQMQQFCQEQN